MKQKQLYINTDNESDIVSLDEIKERYIQINGTEEGFADYVSGGFYDGNIQEYKPI